MREFAGPELSLPVIMLDREGKRYIVATIGELLPFSFGPDDYRR